MALVKLIKRVNILYLTVIAEISSQRPIAGTRHTHTHIHSQVCGTIVLQDVSSACLKTNKCFSHLLTFWLVYKYCKHHHYHQRRHHYYASICIVATLCGSLSDVMCHLAVCLYCLCCLRSTGASLPLAPSPNALHLLTSGQSKSQCLFKQFKYLLYVYFLSSNRFVNSTSVKPRHQRS